MSKHPQEQIDLMIQDYLNNVCIKEILTKYSVTNGTFHYFLDKAGIKKTRRQDSRYKCDETLFDADSEEGKYWLGFCSADCHLCADKEVQLQLGWEDRAELEKFKLALKTDRSIYYYPNAKTPKACLHITSEKLVKALKGFSGTHVLSCKDEFKHHLIRGIFDGDGSVGCKDYAYSNGILYHRLVRICGTLSVVQAISYSVAKLAGCTEGHIRWNNGIYEWGLAGINNVKKYRDWLYQDATIFMQRKKDAFTLLERDGIVRDRIYTHDLCSGEARL